MTCCENCMHKGVCKYKEKLEAVDTAVHDMPEVYSTTDICDVNVKCKFFDYIKPVMR